MLSDKEKEAINELNKRYKFFKENPLATNVWLSLDVYNLGTILNLIEKQSKEIEELNLENIELKQSKIVDKNSIPNQDNFYDCYNFIHKDKIKATIEELDKMKSNGKYTILFNSDNVMDVVKATYQEILSLLEKE